MNSEENLPVGRPVPRTDSFDEIELAGPELTDEEKAWPVAVLRARADSFEEIEASQGDAGTEVVIRVRCDASASPAEVNAFVEKLRSAVEGVQASTANQFPVQIILPAQAG
jgi:hypothetical protein